MFARSKEELDKAEKAVKRVLEELGLELAEDKTNKIDFDEEDFDFLGFAFHHWRKRQKDGSSYYVVGPSVKAIKKFRTDSKTKTKKSCTFSHEKWSEILNPVIRGKVNYMMSITKAQLEVSKELKKRGYRSKCVVDIFSPLRRIDGYIRQRLRVTLIHKNPNRNKAKMGTHQYNNEFFICKIRLVSGHYIYSRIMKPQLSIEEYSKWCYIKGKEATQKRIEGLKKKGKQYYTESRLRQITFAKSHT